VIVAASSPLAKKINISLASLKDEPFILLDEQTMLRQFFIDICTKVGFTPDVVYTSKHTDDIVEMVAAGKGISFMMHHVFSYMNKKSITEIPLAVSVQSQLGIVWPRSAKLSRRAELFTTFVRDNGVYEFE
jgi:LysR family transcriptional activator of glutamate synthase operon